MNTDEERIPEIVRQILGLTPDYYDENGKPLYNVDKLANLLGYEKGVEDPEVIDILSNMDPGMIHQIRESKPKHSESMVNDGNRSKVYVCDACGWRGPKSFFPGHVRILHPDKIKECI